MLWIDGDILVYKCGFGSQRTIHQAIYAPNFVFLAEDLEELEELKKEHGEPLEVTKVVKVMPQETVYPILKATIDSLVSKAGYQKYQVILSSKGELNRKKLYPAYKENRKDTARPFYYDLIRGLLVEKFNATLSPVGYEADDLLGAKLYKSFLENTPEKVDCLASIDKDLNMIPGWHYNMNSEQKYWVTEEEASKAFHMQLLTGDTADNIPGIPGIGPATAEKILADIEVDQYIEVVFAVYLAHALHEQADLQYGDGSEYDRCWLRAKQALELAGKLLWICRKPQDKWVLVLPKNESTISPYDISWSSKGRAKLN